VKSASPRARPTEPIDIKILEVVCEMAPAQGLVPGLRLLADLEKAP
jgi:hypothetical protein